METEKLILIAAAILGIPLLYAVHIGLTLACLKYGRRFCTQRGLTVSNARARPAFDGSGLKTEYTLVELDCLDETRQRKIVRLLVWLFGVHKVLDDGEVSDFDNGKTNQSRG